MIRCAKMVFSAMALTALNTFDAKPPQNNHAHRPFVSQQASIAGTYRIIVCKSTACSVSDTTRAVAWGELVLTDTALPDSVRKRFPYGFVGNTPNGCYKLHRRATEHSFAGLESDAVTFWELNGPKLSFTLYRSPDAAHEVSVLVRGDTLRGSGTSWGPAPEGALTPDYVYAIRVGPSDLRRCRTTNFRRGGV